MANHGVDEGILDAVPRERGDIGIACGGSRDGTDAQLLTNALHAFADLAVEVVDTALDISFSLGSKKDLRENARPELVSYPESLNEYDTVILGYPNYWGTMPMAVVTFLERYDFSGKTILPLCTNEGSGMGGSERELKKACPGAIVKPGLPITGSRAADAKADVKRWFAANGVK